MLPLMLNALRLSNCMPHKLHNTTDFKQNIFFNNDKFPDGCGSRIEKEII